MKTAAEVLDDRRSTYYDDGMAVVPYHEAVEAMEAYSSQSKWISVEERLPEESGYYLVFRKVENTHVNDQHKAMYSNERCIIFYFKERNVTGWQKDWTGNPSFVTHWLPLPSAPREEEKG